MRALAVGATSVGLCLLAGRAMPEDRVQPIDPSVPMFCRDTRSFQPFVRTDLQRLADGFKRQFGWNYAIHSTDSSVGYLIFSEEASTSDPERIVYDVEPYQGGVALLHMHVRLKGKSEDLSGTTMCGRTLQIVNAS